MKDKISAVKGFKDILPAQNGKWQHVEATARRIFADFNFQEMRVPIVEKTTLFVRSIGEATDIVEKEMYTFQDRNEDYLTLRPEATASVLRAYIEHSLFASDQVVKLFTIGPMFRRERPQKGRFRQFHQIDAEVLGLDDPKSDAELLLMLMNFFRQLGLLNLKLEINSLGCHLCRPFFRQAITEYFQGKEGLVCADCQRRLKVNPLRIFDCKVEGCRDVIAQAPALLNYLCQDCSSHFSQVKKYLEVFDLKYFVNDKMVRGLDYYTKTTFEVITEHGGAQHAVVGGGRYDGLIKELGGPDIPGIGFAVGVERLISLLPGSDDDFNMPPLLFIATQGEPAGQAAFLLGNRLRLKGVRTEMNYTGKSLKGQMKQADKLACAYTLILGERELAQGEAELRDMKKATQQKVKLTNLEDVLINILK